MADFAGSTGDDLLVGTDVNDHIYGLEGDDILVGSGGNDTMAGGSGADVFVFSFGARAIAAGSSSFSDWLSANQYAPIIWGGTSEQYFGMRYGEWLHELVQAYALGADVDGDGEVRVSLDLSTTDSTPKIEGMTRTELEAVFDNSQRIMLGGPNGNYIRWFQEGFHSTARTIYSGNGSDVILDFNPAEGDRLAVIGVTNADASHFHSRQADINSDGYADTVITLDTDPTWSLTMLGYDSFRPDIDVIPAPPLPPTQPPAAPPNVGITFNGGENSESIGGTDLNDVLFGNGGNDSISGLGGNDIMLGGEGADSFMLDFGPRMVPAGTSSFSDWLSATHDAQVQIGITSTAQFTTWYTEWLESLADQYALGIDTNGDGQITVGLNPGTTNPTPVIEGLEPAQVSALFTASERVAVVNADGSSYVRWVYEGFGTLARPAYSGPGSDAIYDFNPDAGDRLVVRGVDADHIGFFRAESADVDGNGVMDTHVTLTTDPTWSLDLMGYNEFSVNDVMFA